MMKRLAPLVLALFAPLAFAQRTIDFDVSTTTGDGEVVTTVAWATNPPAPGDAPCEATGAPEWAGPKSASGTEQLTLTESVTLNLACTWPGDTLATLTYTIPTMNTDGSPYTDPRGTLIAYAFEAVPTGTACRDALTSDQAMPGGCDFVDDPGQQTRTITGLEEVGTYNFVVFACNQRNVCSDASNVAAKMFTGMVTATESVGIVVNPIPSRIVDLRVE